MKVLEMLLAGLVLATAAIAEEMGKLTMRVSDAETNQTLPARVVLRSSDGTYPGDRIACSAARWPHLEMHGIFLAGEQTFDLPVGKTEVAAAHGLEYHLERREVAVQAGEPKRLEFKLRRVFSMRHAGWVAGDMHMHMLHGENQRATSYADVATTCDAGGLDFAYIGQEYVGAGKLDLQGYEAECAKVSNANFRLLLGGERPKSLLGHQVLIGVRNPFLIGEDPPYYDSAEKVHAQGGALVYVHPVRYFPGKKYQGKWLDFPGVNLARELVFDSFLGPSFDGLSVLSDEPANPQAYGLWVSLLNRGLFVPVFADSDACFDRLTLDIKTPGLWTTYLHVGREGKMDHETLSSAVRAGRTLATTGPLLQFSIDGQISGATIAPDGTRKVMKIEAWLPQHAFTLETKDPKSGRPSGIGRVELIRNGTVVKKWEPHTPHVEISEDVSESEPCWYVVRVFGEDATWQVGVASPIYFSAQPMAAKREPLPITVRGRIYGFHTGEEQAGTVEIRRHGKVTKSFPARGRFRVRMPLDAEVLVDAKGFRPGRRNLLMDYGPVHRFLWYLESKDLAQAETYQRFQALVENVELEFPLGYRMPGSYIAEAPVNELDWATLRAVGGPDQPKGGSVAVAAVLMDSERISPGRALKVAAIFRSEGDIAKVGPLVVEARGYDPARPTAYGALKKFAEFEKRWDNATDLGNGYRMISGELKVADWVQPGPTGGVDISVRARRGSSDAAFIGLHVPLGETQRALSISSGWPTMPLSWPDGRYGIGPFLLCNRAGREGRPKADYRQLHLELKAGDNTLDLLPARDARGTADADDALYTGQFFDQVLNDESQIDQPPSMRSQPVSAGWEQVDLVDATH